MHLNEYSTKTCLQTAAVSCFLLVTGLRAETPYVVHWTRQLGTSGIDTSLSVSANRLGSVHIAGTTTGSLGGESAGTFDSFVSKYDASGNLLWSRQLGSTTDDIATGVASDGLGNAYVSGFTQGSMATTSAGSHDAFLCKYDESGVLQWVRQFGTSDGDFAKGVSADGLGNVYVSGYSLDSVGGTSSAWTADVFVRKYDDSGNLQWTRRWGTMRTESSNGFNEISNGISTDRLGNVYVAGQTDNPLGGPDPPGWDAFIVKYDASGTLQWSQQFGTSLSDYATSLSTDGLGNAYLSGETTGSLDGSNMGEIDAFVSKYDASGTQIWVRQFGSSRFDLASGVSADGMGSVYVTGSTFAAGPMGGPSPDSFEAYVSKYDDAGALQWTRQLGTNKNDASNAIVSDGAGSVYISGQTYGSIAIPNLGESDAFVVHLIPEPASVALAAVGLLAGLRFARRRQSASTGQVKQKGCT